MNNFEKIRAWAEARNIIKGATAVSQFAKLISEYGELAGHIEEMAELQRKGRDETGDFYNDEVQRIVDAMVDDVGDMLVVLTIIGAQLNVQIENLAPDSLVKGTEMLQLATAYGKIGDAILKNDIESFKELVPCVFAVLSVMAADLGVTFDDAMAAAYEDIKDRKGVMYNGTFIKSTDARYESVLKDLGLS